jgi:hypothetical protein
MCSRPDFNEYPRALARYFGLADVPQLAPRYNVAPSPWVAVVGLKPGGLTERRSGQSSFPSMKR